MIELMDFLVFFGGWGIAQMVFSGYEAHVPGSKRLLKILILGAIFGLVHVLVGRWLFYSLLGTMALGIAILHGYWFHWRNGIHWRKAEPRDKYLRLIGFEKDQ